MRKTLRGIALYVFAVAIITIFGVCALAGKSLAAADTDGDFLTDYEEGILGTDPTLADTDGDGVDDIMDLFPLDTTEQADSDKEIQTIGSQGRSRTNASAYGDYVVWEDNRNGVDNIYLYRVSTSTETQLTPDGSSQRNPSIYGNKVVWEDYRDGNEPEIYMYNTLSGVETRLTNDSARQKNPSAYGGRVAWEDYRHGSSPEIYLLNISTGAEFRLTNDTSRQTEPAMNGDYIVWKDEGTHGLVLYKISAWSETVICSSYCGGGDHAIWGDHVVWSTWDNSTHADIVNVYDIPSASTTTISTVDTRSIDRVSVHGDRVVWSAFRFIDPTVTSGAGVYDVYLHDLSTGTGSRISPYDDLGYKNPAIYGDRIVWESENDLHLYDIATTTVTAITEQRFDRRRPDIWGNRVAWIDYRNGNSEIYVTDINGNGATRLSFDTSSQIYPDISGDRIAWMDSRHGDWEAYLYDLSTKTETRLTNHPGVQASPKVSGGRVAWEDDRHRTDTTYNVDVYVYDIATSTETRVTIDDGVIQRLPDIYGDTLAWSERWLDDTGAYAYGVYTYDIPTSTKELVSTAPAVPNGIAISGGRVAWGDHRNGNWDIYMYDKATGVETQVTSDPGSQERPAISGDTIAWVDNRNGNWDIYSYDIAAGIETQVTSTAYDEAWPAVFGSTIVWEGEDTNKLIYILKGDGYGDNSDNCPDVYNPDQFDMDEDGIGDGCDADMDNDGVSNDVDSCPDEPRDELSPLHLWYDHDGDGCNWDQVSDYDNDGVPEYEDNCPSTPNTNQANADGDSLGDACDLCPNEAVLDEEDNLPDGCIDGDYDGDGVHDTYDNCPYEDSTGYDDEYSPDGCINDTDGDGVLDNVDVCPDVVDFDQVDSDGDGLGDACEVNTDLGTDVVVELWSGIGDVTFTFDNVTAWGDTLIGPGDGGDGGGYENPPAPEGFKLMGDETEYFDISTTATFDGQVEICFNVGGTGDTSIMRFYHYENGAWVDITTSNVDGYVCGVTSSFSPFAIFSFEPLVGVDSDGDGDGVADSDDACPLENATGYDVDNDGCIDGFSGLKDIVDSLVTEGVIDDTLRTSILQKIANAERSADRENICAASNQLTAFINEVNAQRGGKVSDEAADEVIAYTESVIAYLTGQLPEGDSC